MAAEINPSSCVFVPYDTVHGRETYIACYEDAWRIAHGSLAGFQADSCWYTARRRAEDDRDALSELRFDGQFAGVLCLDDRRGRFRGHGWIAFCYILPDLRGRGLGRALIRHAEEYFRARGRRVLRLTVAPGNPALQFYEKTGFACVGTEPGALEDLFVMEKKL